MEKLPSLEESITICNKLDINIDKNSFNNLSSDFIAGLFFSIIEKLTDVNRRNLSLEFDVIKSGMFIYKGNHDNSIYKLKLFFYIKSYFNKIGINEYNINEFLIPDKKRTLIYFRKLIKILKLENEEKEKINNFKDSLNNIETQIFNNNNDLKQKENELKIIKNKKIQNENEIKLISTNIENFNLENNQLRTQILNQESELKKLNDNLKEINDKINYNEQIQTNISNKIKILNEKIVKSPEKNSIFVKQC